MKSGEIRFARKKWWIISLIDHRKGVCHFDDGALAHFSLGPESLECRGADGHLYCSVDIGSDRLSELCFGRWQRPISGAPENAGTLFIKHEFLTLEIGGRRHSLSPDNPNEKNFYHSIQMGDLTSRFTIQDSVPVWPVVTSMFVQMLLWHASPCS